MRVPLIAVIDALLIVLFVIIGRSSHTEGLTPVGIADTAWPFLLAAAVGWAFAYVLSAIRGHDPGDARSFAPGRILPAGVIIWVCTVAVGMTARGLLTESGVQPSFVVVATIALGVFLLGWRAIARTVALRRARSRAQPPTA